MGVAIGVLCDSGDIMTKYRSSSQIGICGSPRKSVNEDDESQIYREVIPAARHSGRRHMVPTSSCDGEIKASCYYFYTDRFLKR